jgi:uncharacterized protein with FMN-binding domain
MPFMDRNEPAAYWLLLGLTIALSILAVVTMIPNPGASKPNVLGYRSVCSFAPAASALCGLLAGITCTVRNRRVSRRAASARYRPFILPGAVAILLLVIAAVFGIRFGVAQRRFGSVIAATRPSPAALPSLADGSRSAEASEGEISARVEVTVRGGRIEALRLLAGVNVDAALAATIFERVQSAQSLRVDTVSGATASCNVLLAAIDAAASPSP